MMTRRDEPTRKTPIQPNGHSSDRQVDTTGGHPARNIPSKIKE